MINAEHVFLWKAVALEEWITTLRVLVSHLTMQRSVLQHVGNMMYRRNYEIRVDGGFEIWKS